VRASLLTFRGVVRHGWVTEFYGHHHRFVWWEQLLPVVAPVEIGVAIASVWLVQWLSGRWRARPVWTDRVGRCLGSFWLVWGLAEEVRPWEFLEKDINIRIFNE
jgi:hypothetical protein